MIKHKNPLECDSGNMEKKVIKIKTTFHSSQVVAR